MELPGAYLERLRLQLGEGGLTQYLKAMDKPPVRGLRVNTLKLTPGAFLCLSPWRLSPLPGISEGFILEDPAEGIGNHPLHRAGYCYLQEPSAMEPAALLNPNGNMRVLDLCAAPGGKATALAARLAGQGLLIANEVVAHRAEILKRNIQRMGIRNALITVMQPEPLCKVLEGWCDAVLVDAPCSGEGMFRKDPKAIREWSLGHVAACARRAGHILDCAAMALRPGGKLVYSTCTFSPEEDEAAVEAFLARHGNFLLVSARRFWPHLHRGEGHFMALLMKNGGKEQLAAIGGKNEKAQAPAAWTRFVEENMTAAPGGIPRLLPDGRLMLLPEGLPPGYEAFRIAACGVHAGDMKGDRFAPNHGLFMAYPVSAFQRRVYCGDEMLGAYFAGNTVLSDLPGKGFCAVTGLKMNWPVGFGKLVDGVVKNHLPKGLRQ